MHHRQFRSSASAFATSAALLLLMGGCAVPNKYVAQYDKSIEYQYPAISIFRKQISNELRHKCQRVYENCRVNDVPGKYYWSALTNTHLFERVLLAEAGTDYQVLIGTVVHNHTNAAGLAKAAFLGLTLGLVPVSFENTAELEYTVTWSGIPIKEYRLTVPYALTITTLEDTDATRKRFAEMVVSHFIKHAQIDEIFSTEYLHNALDACNYERDLKAPERALQ